MKRAIFLTAIIFLAVACSPVKKYTSSEEVLSWENDIRNFEQLDKTETYPENAILFTGSSSIRLWSTIATDMAPYDVIQRGFGGSKLSDFAVYVDRIVSPHHCSPIVIFIGNDITGADNDKSPQEVASLFRYSLSRIRKTHPKTPVFWIEVTPTPLRWNVWPKIQEAGSLIKNICVNSKNAYYISTSASFLNADGTPIKEYFRPDNLHLNEKGYEIWSKIIKDELRKVIPYPDAK